MPLTLIKIRVLSIVFLQDTLAIQPTEVESDQTDVAFESGHAQQHRRLLRRGRLHLPESAQLGHIESCESLSFGHHVCKVVAYEGIPVVDDASRRVGRITVVDPSLVCKLYLLANLVQAFDHIVMHQLYVQVGEDVDDLVTDRQLRPYSGVKGFLTKRMYLRASEDRPASLLASLAFF
jgi:hypothetical protein